MNKEIALDEVAVTYIVHGGDPKTCRRCFNSIRQACKECGHTLSANIDHNNNTTCEYCGLYQHIEKY